VSTERQQFGHFIIGNQSMMNWLWSLYDILTVSTGLNTDELLVAAILVK
jgi:hypothetical protein